MSMHRGASLDLAQGTALAIGLAILLAGLVHIVYLHLLFDDAFISFRYAENLAHGLGLVYNAGEHVEGYSNFLWTLMMSVVVLLGGRPEVWAPRLSALFALATLALVMWAARRRGVPLALAGFLLAASTAWATWATGGLETSLFTLCLTLGAIGLAFAGDPRTGTGPARTTRWLLASALGFALACLTRPDGPVAAAGGAILVLVWTVRGVLSRRAALTWAAIPVLCVVPHLFWRLAYYGHLFPNTLAVKSPGLSRLASGWRYLADAARDLHLYLLLLAVLAALALRAKPPGWRARDSAAIAAVVLPFCVYLAFTGGDFMPAYRFVAPLLPLVSLAGAAALTGLVARLRQPGRGAMVGLAATLVIAYAALNVRYSVRQQGEWVTHGMGSVGSSRHEVDDWVRLGDLLRTIAGPGDTLATTAAGAVPYRSKLYTLDMLGLAAPDLASFRELRDDRPGHQRLLSEARIVARPPQILLAHPMVRPTTAHVGLSYDMRPEWRDRVMANYELIGLRLPGSPDRFVACAIRRDCVERIAGKRAAHETAERPRSDSPR